MCHGHFSPLGHPRLELKEGTNGFLPTIMPIRLETVTGRKETRKEGGHLVLEAFAVRV